ncbi:hypothetical protein JOB18_041092 [Solea senegalensis]|uniref:Uncharacterized protein n=1 Tax=Solea senegalensis TaxID=28829 RepID=A0AAV6SID8_SOLSE|nr:hypothetical protein JOB18_041092 [Solea senegalensis]
MSVSVGTRESRVSIPQSIRRNTFSLIINGCRFITEQNDRLTDVRKSSAYLHTYVMTYSLLTKERTHLPMFKTLNGDETMMRAMLQRSEDLSVMCQHRCRTQTLIISRKRLFTVDSPPPPRPRILPVLHVLMSQCHHVSHLKEFQDFLEPKYGHRSYRIARCEIVLLSSFVYKGQRRRG